MVIKNIMPQCSIKCILARWSAYELKATRVDNETVLVAQR
jgi:hypothetical protein